MGEEGGLIGCVARCVDGVCYQSAAVLACRALMSLMRAAAATSTGASLAATGIGLD